MTIFAHRFHAAPAAGLFLVLLCAGGSGCRPPRENAVQDAPPPVVRTTRAMPRQIHREHRLIAHVKPLKKVPLIARVDGFLKLKNFSEGAFVRKGDLLYRIEEAPYELAVLRAQAQLARAQAQALNAQLEFNRVKPLYHEKIASASRFDRARAELDAAQAEVRAAQAALRNAEINFSYTRICAPFDGWIGLSRVDEGAYLPTSGPPLAEIAYIDEVRVEFHLSDAWLAGKLLQSIASGRIPDWQVRLSLPDGSTPKQAGKITWWNNQLATDTATLAMQAKFDNRTRKLLPGLYVTAHLRDPQPETVLLLDRGAIRRNQGEAFTFVVDAHDKLELRMLKLGDGAGDLGNAVIVHAGLAPGERTVLAGNPFLRPGQTVRVAP